MAGTQDHHERWRALAPDIPLDLLKRENGVADALITRAREYAHQHPGSFTVAVVPETRSRSWLDVIRLHGLAQRVKADLVGDGPAGRQRRRRPRPCPSTISEPITHHVVVLVAEVHKGTLRALAYAKGLHATSVAALSISLEHERSTALLDEWEDWGIDVPLELVDSLFRSIADTLRTYVRNFDPDGWRTVVTCVLPEFVLDHWWHRPLHNQTALLIKSTLLFEAGVVTTSVPYRVNRRAGRPG